MRIGVTCNALGRGGGMERYAADVVDELVREGHRPTVFARRFDEPRDDVETVRLGVGWVPGKLRDHLFTARLERARERHPVDVLFGCTRNRSSDVAVCGGTHIGHGLACGRRIGFWDRRQIELERAFYARAEVVVAHSRAMESELRRHYAVPEEKIEVLYPPVDLGRFHPVDDDARHLLRRAFGLPEDRVIFVFPSSGHRRKGLDVLAAVFETTDLPVALAVAGRSSGRSHPAILDLGWVGEMERLYQAADYTILASDYEPFGLVGPESIACGTPVVFAETLGCREVIDPIARIDFRRGDRASLEQALALAVERAWAGRHRDGVTRAALTYDPSVATHVRALLDIAEAIAAGK